METMFSNMNLRMSFPTDSAKLMKCKLVSRNRQMELPVSICVSSKRGHRCGACHNASDAKVRTVKQFTKLESNRYFLRVSVSMYLILPM